MHGHDHHITHVEDPGGVSLPAGLKTGLLALGGIGLLLWFASFFVGAHGPRPWQALLLAYMYFLMLGLGGVVYTAIQYCASAKWSIATRRIAEGFGTFIPFAFVVFILLMVFGYGPLYKDAVKDAHMGADKTAFLSLPAMLAKGALFYGLWFFLASKIRGNSLRQDATKDPAISRENVKWSIAFIMIFAYTFTLHVIDLLMALEPRWFSTMFGVYCFAGLFLSTMCVHSIVVIAMRRRRSVSSAITPRHLYDIGTWIMAFSCFMMYVGFSQYMLIWYANLPEETFYMIRRTEHGWQWVTAILPLFKWVIPFLVLMPQAFRANTRVIVGVACAVLIGQWLDLYWIIYPPFAEAGPVMPGLAELGSFLAMLGLFVFAVDRVYARHSVLPMGDPHLAMSADGSYI